MKSSAVLRRLFAKIHSMRDLQAGVRKIRVPLMGRGKRRGARVVYYFIERKGKVYLLDVFAKNERTALTKTEQNEVRTLTRILEEEA